MATLNRIEIRYLPSTVNSRVAFPTFYITETYSELTAPITVNVPLNQLQASLLVSEVSDNDQSTISPLAYYAQDILKDDFNIYRNGDVDFSIRNGSTVLGRGSGSGLLHYLYFACVITSDGYVAWTFKTYANTANYTNIYCTSNKYGYSVGYDNGESTFIISSKSAFSLGANKTLFDVSEIFVESTDPYDGAGTSEGNEDDGGSGESGGHGTLDNSTDTISVPDPTSNLSAVTTGFITLFTPTVSQLQSLADYMWSDLFDLDTFKKIFADPMDAILGLSIVPVSIPSSGTTTVTVGNISTGVSMNKASTQYVQVDCGTLSVEEYVGSYLDYAPYTKAYIYLPYVGIQAIEIDDIMGKTVGVKYNIDVLSGSCAVFITANGTVIATFQGQCSVSIPISANDYTSTISSAIGLISKGVTLAAAAGAGGLATPLVAMSMASASSDVMKSKPSIEKGGSVGSMGGMLGVQTPYIIMTRPRQSVPKFQNIMKGYPSNVYSVLGNLTGFTIVDEIHLAQLDATETEKAELKDLLLKGVIL